MRIERRAILSACLGLVAAPAARAAPDDAFRMKVAGREWAATRSAAFRVATPGTITININGFLDGPKLSKVGFLIYPASEDAFEHTFDFAEIVGPNRPAHKNSGTFNVDMMGGNPLDDSFRFISGNLTITAFDRAKKTLSGTFMGQLRSLSDSTTFAVTDGRFAGVDLTP